MTFKSKYHNVVKPELRRLIPVSLVFFGLLSLPLLASNSAAQNSSAISSGSGHAVGATPSFISPNYNPHVPGVPSSTKTPPPTNGSRGNNNPPQHPSNTPQAFYYYYPYVYAIPVPLDLSDNGPSDDDPDYQGGPTVFDRRGAGPASYIPPVSPSPDPEQAADADAAEEAPAADLNSDADLTPVPTVLVFKDGRQVDIDNYAIVAQTLYDLTPGHPRKIALSDLDLPATQKENDDRGITFDLPPSAQAN